MVAIRIITLSFLFVVFCHASNAQFKYLQEGDEWAIYGMHKDKPFTYSYVISGDTLIDEVKYKKLHRRVYTKNRDSYNQVELSYIRMDRSMGEMFVYEPWSKKEKLLYNFDLKVGDTIPSNAQIGENAVVVAIDTVQIGNKNAARWLLKSTSSQTNTPFMIIEGIGTSHGFYQESVVDFEYPTRLAYFERNGTLLFPLDKSKPENIQPKKDMFENIMVQQTESQVVISKKETIAGIFKRTRLYSPYGKKIKQADKTKNKVVFSKESLEKGIYTYEVKVNPNMVSSGRILIY